MTRPPAGPVALALDELLCDPALHHLLPELRRCAPTWLSDQIGAATADVHRRWQHTADAGLTDRSFVPTTDVPGWVRLGGLTALTEWLTDAADTCMHSPQPSRPRPIAATAWRPHLVVCGNCCHLLNLPRNSAADRTCDGCGRITAGLAADDGIRPAGVLIGPLTYMYGMCGDCDYLSDIATSPPASP